MFKRTILVLLSLMLVLCMGCGNKDKTDYSKMTPKERVVHLHNKFYMPLAKTYYDFVVDYNMAYNSNTTLSGFYKDVLPLYEKKYLPYIKDLRSKFPRQDTKEMQEIEPYVSVLYDGLFNDTVGFFMDKIKYTKDSLDAKGDLKECLDPMPKEGEDTFFDANLMYNHEYSKIVNGKGTYELTKANFNKLRKGMTIREVSLLMKMPPTISFEEQKDNKNNYAYFWVIDNGDQDYRYMYDETQLKPTDKYIKLIFRLDEDTFAEKLIKAENHGVE